MKAWLFPAPEQDRYAYDYFEGGEDEDVSGIEVKEEKSERSEPKETDTDGDAMMGDLSAVKTETTPPAPAGPPAPIVVTTNVSFSNKIPCSNMIFANGRLISCGKAPESFVHWNFVCTRL